MANPVGKYETSNQIRQKANILNIRFSKKKSVDSEIKDNVVIDYDENHEIVNLEIMKVDLREFVRFAKTDQSILEFTAWCRQKVNSLADQVADFKKGVLGATSVATGVCGVALPQSGNAGGELSTATIYANLRAEFCRPDLDSCSNQTQEIIINHWL